MNAKRPNGSPIAIVGMACRYPGAADPRELWENVLTRRRQFRRIPRQRLSLDSYVDPDPLAPDKTYQSRAAVLDGFSFDWVSRRIPQSTYESTDTAHWLALEVALQALEDAGISPESVPRERSGVIVGNTLTGEKSRSEALRLRWPFVERVLHAAGKDQGISDDVIGNLSRAVERQYKSVFTPVTEDSLAGGLSNTIAGRICNFLDLHGGGYTVDGACASSLIAVATAASSLRGGDLDLALAGGVDISLDPFELVGFAKMGALASGEMTVFDRRAGGFIPGEGCGFVVLKRLEDARRDGDAVYAVLHGWGISSDGKGGITAPSAAGQAAAIRRAYERAPYVLQRIDFIECHGTGTTVGDPAELEGIAQALGEAPAGELRAYGVTSLKSIIGHTKAAAGIGGLIKAVAAVNRRIVPPTAGCTEPHPLFRGVARSLYPVQDGELRDPAAGLRAGVSGAGFGGINCHVTLESDGGPSEHLAPSVEERALLASAQRTELFVIEAPSWEGLRERIAEAGRLADGASQGELTDLAALLAGQAGCVAPVRAAAVADSPEGLRSRLEELDRLAAAEGGEQGTIAAGTGGKVWIGGGVRRHRVGFLFPGQGSQQLNMARVLVERHGWAREIVEMAGEALREVGCAPIEPLLFKPLHRAPDEDRIKRWSTELTQTEVAQPAISLASLLWLTQLRRLGIEPVAAGGHSLGELAAFFTAGAFGARALLGLAAVRGRCMKAGERSAGAMISLRCDRETAAALADDVPGYCVVANVNAPRQVVLSGEAQAIEAAADLARERGVPARRLSVSNAFHSRLMEQAAQTIRDAAPLPATLGPPRVRLFTGVDGSEVTEGAPLDDHFARQVLAPVDFVSLAQSLARHCDLLVEVGPGRVLSALTREILGRDGAPCLPVESRPGHDEDWNRVLACYFVHGGTVRWNALYENRLVRPFVAAANRLFFDNPCERPFTDSALLDAEIPVVEAAGTTAPRPAKAPAGREDTAELLLDLVSSRTGFPKESLSLELHLLDDLNLDSIKASELVAEAAQRVGVAGRFDPARLAGSTLGELAAALEQLAEEATSPTLAPASVDEADIAKVLLGLVAEGTGLPREALSPSLRLREDLKLDENQAGELIAKAARRLRLAADRLPARFDGESLEDVAAALRLLIRSTAAASPPELVGASRPWVRDFAVEMTAEKAAAASATDRPGWAGARVLVLGETEQRLLGDVLARHFEDAGASVRRHPFRRSADEAPSPAEDCSHIVVLLPRDGDATAGPAVRLRRVVELLASVAGQLSSSPRRPPATVGFVQFGNGWFGTRGEVGPALGACALAWASSLHLEQPARPVRVLDFATDAEEEFVAQNVLHELATEPGFAAVGYGDDGIRRVPRPVALDPADYRRRGFRLTARDVVLVTGGAKGITAECALALARATGATMALVGSSEPAAESTDPTPRQDPIAATLGRFEAEGLSCRYYSCDVTDEVAVRALVDRVRSELGTITGVVHGAGVNHPGTVERVSAEAAYREVAPKVLGARNLMRCLEDRPPRLLVGLTSIIGVTGLAGNAWYGFSNEVLDRTLGRFAETHPGSEVLSVAFSVWGEAGMAPRLGIVQRLAESGVGSIPTGEGTSRLVRLIESDPGRRQVVVASRMPELPLWRPQAFARPPVSRFLEDVVAEFPRVEVVARAGLTFQRDRYLEDHDWRGSHLFPFVFGLEAMAQAVALVSGEGRLEPVLIEDIRLDRPIVVRPDSTTRIEVGAEALERRKPGEARRFRASVRAEQTGFGPPHFSATFVLGPHLEPRSETIRLPDRPLDIAPREDLYSWLLFQGRRFQRLSRVHILNSEQCVFESVLRPGEPAGATTGHDITTGPWLLGDPYFRDSLLHTCQMVITQAVCLPVRIGRIEIHRLQAGEERRVVCSAALEERTEETIRYQVRALDESGRVAEAIEGCVQRILETHEEYPTAEELVAPGPRDHSRLVDLVSACVERFALAVPAVRLAHLPLLRDARKEDRHREELAELEQVAAEAAARIGSGEARRAEIRWDDSGRPVVRGRLGGVIGVSAAHDGATFLCVAGPGPQGCDIETITPRRREEWTSLLGARREGLLRRLERLSDGLDQAGTRIWAAAEAARKALQEKNLNDMEVEASENGPVLLRVVADAADCRVLTLPLRLSRGRRVVIALVVRGSS